MCNPVGFTAQELISNLPALCTSTITNAAYKLAEEKFQLLLWRKEIE